MINKTKVNRVIENNNIKYRTSKPINKVINSFRLSQLFSNSHKATDPLIHNISSSNINQSKIKNMNSKWITTKTAKIATGMINMETPTINLNNQRINYNKNQV